METITKWKEVAMDSFQGIVSNIAEALPSILGAIVVLVLGWFVIKIVLYVFRKLLSLGKVDQWGEKLNLSEIFGKSNLSFNPSKVILGFLKWLLWLIVLIVAADIMHWEIISNEIANLLHYMPRLLSAVALFVIGIYIANFIKKALLGVFESFELRGGKIISNLVFYIITIFIAVTALNQAGVDTTIITTNISLIIGAFLLAVAIGFGLGSKEVITQLLWTFYARRNYVIGDRIEVGDLVGTIDAIDNATVTLKTKEGKIIVPIKEIVESRVKVDH